MTQDQIKALFPIKAEITEDIIFNALPFNAMNCVGALTLKSILPEELHSYIRWGTNEGNLFNNSVGDDFIRIGTIENVNMICIRHPQEVTFIIAES